MEKITETKRTYYLEKLQQLTPMDDIFMRRLFKDNTQLTEWMLRILLDKKDLKVIKVTTQSDFKQLTGTRSVTFDVDATDDDGKRYDIEFQNESAGAKPERARFHSAMLDRDALKANEDFDQLPETYVIFITGKDYFKKALPVYHIERIVLETEKNFNDRAHILYVNSEYNNDDPIGKLLHDLRCSDPKEMYYDIIRKDTAYLKTNDEEMKKMSGIVEELINEGRNEGRLEGISIGEQRGRQEGISIGHAEAEKKYRAQLEAARAEIARLKTQQNKALKV